MCDVEQRCQYKQRVAGKCRPRETGRSQSPSPGGICFNVRAILDTASTLKQLLVPKAGNPAPGQRSAQQPELGSEPNLKQEFKATLDSLDTLTAQPQSPLPEADYDKLLVSGKQ